METLTTKEAAVQLGVSVQKVHRATAQLGLVPMLKLPGRTGAKVWTPNDIELVRKHLHGKAAAS